MSEKIPYSKEEKIVEKHLIDQVRKNLITGIQSQDGTGRYEAIWKELEKGCPRKC